MASTAPSPSFDGCKTIKVPDTPRNRGWLGKMNAVNGETGHPVIQLMTLVETGTRALLGAVFGTTAVDELDWARKLLRLLDTTMLVLLDRRFDAAAFLAELAAARAPVPGAADRVPPAAGPAPPARRVVPLADRRGEGPVITAEVTVTCHDGTSYGGSWRLATTLLDHRTYPADALMRLYRGRLDSSEWRLSVLEQRVGTGPGVRDLDCDIAQVRPDMETAIEGQDFEKAAVLRDRERQLLSDKTAREQEWAALPSLSEEIERFRDLLRRHGIDPQDGAA